MPLKNRPTAFCVDPLPRLNRAEALLLLAVVALLALALLGPPLALPAHYHQFADQRTWLGIPCALDVLSNAPFVLWGGAGLWALGRLPGAALSAAQRGLATLFFAGLVVTGLASAWYHGAADDAGLAIDRLGMSLAFAALLGLACASRISDRAGLALAGALLVLAPAAVASALWLANMLGWAVLQGGAAVSLLVLAGTAPRASGLPVRLWAVVGWYALAKLFEWGDHAVWAWSDGALAGHSLKHMAASLAAWPVWAALRALQTPSQSVSQAVCSRSPD